MALAPDIHHLYPIPSVFRRSRTPSEAAAACEFPPGAAGQPVRPARRSNTFVKASWRFLFLIGSVVLFPVTFLCKHLLYRSPYGCTLVSLLLASSWYYSPVSPPVLVGSPSTSKVAIASSSLVSSPSWLYPWSSPTAVLLHSTTRDVSFFPVLLPVGAASAVVGGVNEDDSAKNAASNFFSSAGSDGQKGRLPASASSTGDGGGRGNDDDSRTGVSTRDLTEEQRHAIEASKAEILEKKEALEISGLENYKKFHRTHPVSMVMFYAAWCVWSRRAMSEYNGLALMMVHREPPLILAKVDASAEEDIASLENVMEFPLLKLYVEGRPQQYMGSVTRAPMISWLNDKLDRDHLLGSAPLIDVFVTSGPHNLVVIAAFQRGAPKQAFVRLARALADDVVFGHVESPELIQHLKERHVERLLDEEEKRLQQQQEGLSKLAVAAAAAASARDLQLQQRLEAQLRWEREYIEEQQREQKERRAAVSQAVQRLPFIIALSKASVDPPVHVFEGNPSDLQKLEAFVLRYRFPLLTVLRPQRLPDNFFQDRRPLALLILDTRADPGALRGIEELQGVNAATAAAGPPHPLVAALMKSGTKHRHALVCTVAGNTEPHERYFLDLLGVEDEQLPSIRAMTLQSEGESRVHPEFKYKPTVALMQRLGVSVATSTGSQGVAAAEGGGGTTSPLEMAARAGRAGTAAAGGGGESGSATVAAGAAAAGKTRDAVGGGKADEDGGKVRNQSSDERFAGGEQNVVLTPEVLTAFLEAFIARDVEPYYRSEALPEEEEQQNRRPGTVRTLVGLNYRQVLFDTDDDVLVEFYAPWCGHCRKFEPAYKELAARLRDVDGIFLAKVDGNRNEIPGMRITAYPTLILFPAKTKRKLGTMQTARSYWYNGDKTMADMLEWLAARTEKAHIDVDRLLAINLAQRDATEAAVGGTVTKSVLEEL